MSQPEWMQKFKQIGLKSQEAVVTVDATSGEIIKTGETETSRFEKFDKPHRDSAANTTTPPWLQQQQQQKRASTLPPPKRPDAEDDEEDAAALFAAAANKPVIKVDDETEKESVQNDEDAAALFAQAGSQPAVKPQNDADADANDEDAAALFAAAGAAKTNALSPAEQEQVDTYRRMLNMGLPEGAVIQKMSINEVPSHIQDAVLKPVEETPGSGETMSAEDQQLVDKYRKMLSMGMPEGAVMQKMTVDEVAPHIQEAVLKPVEEAPTSTPPPPAAVTTAALDTQDTQSIEEEIIEEEVIEESVIEESMVEESVVSSSMMEESVLSASVKETPPQLGELSEDQASLPPQPSEQKMTDEEFGEPWVVDRDRVLHDLSTTRFEEVEVSRDTGHVHYDEVFIDENGNEVIVRHSDPRLEPDEIHEIFVDDDGKSIEEEIQIEETVEPPPPSVRQQPPVIVQSQVTPQEAEAAPPLEPPYDPAFDVENQRKLLQRGSKAYRSRMAGWVPYLFLLTIIATSLLVVFFVILADDDGIDIQSVPTMAPTTKDYVPLDPTNTGAIDVAATTPLAPVTGNCNFRGVEQPHVIDQCVCDGTISIIANDIRQRYESLLDNFVPDVLPDFNESIDSCDPSNQALIWLSSGTNNAGEAEPFVRQERFALAYFYLDQAGLAWADNLGWLSEQDACQWDRVTCDQDGRVVGLDVSENQVIGQVSTEQVE